MTQQGNQKLLLFVEFQRLIVRMIAFWNSVELKHQLPYPMLYKTALNESFGVEDNILLPSENNISLNKQSVPRKIWQENIMVHYFVVH